MSTNQERRCLKCGGEVHEGELFITITSSPSNYFLQGVGAGVSSLPYPMRGEQQFTGEGPFWRERTGQKKGWLVKREETQIFKVSGLRCVKCNFIELHAHE